MVIRIGLWLIVTTLLLATRFALLGDKTFHHDEAMYAVYSTRVANQLEYQFNPMLHGPSLYFIQGTLFRLFGISDYTARLTPAIFGTLAILGIFLMFYFSSYKKAAFAWLILATSSPALCYFSRFLGMDSLMLGLFVAILCVLFAMNRADPQTSRSFSVLQILFPFLLATFVATKLNFLFYLIVAACGLGYAYIYDKDRFRIFIRKIFPNSLAVIKAILTFCFIFSFLYSGAFKYPDGILDGLYRKMIPYWTHQNSIERIKGDFFYYIPLMLTYEIPIILGFLFMTWCLLKKNTNLFGKIVVTSAVLWIAVSRISVLREFLDQRFHMHQSWDLALAIGISSILIWWIRKHLLEHDLLRAFILTWIALLFFTHSYAGEKVPWLILHTVFPAYIYLALSFSHLKLSHSAKVLAALFVVFQLANLFRSSFYLSDSAKESFVYTHTTREFRNLELAVKKLAKQLVTHSRLDNYKDFPIQVEGKSIAVWPSYWYFRDFSHWYYPVLEPDKKPYVTIEDTGGDSLFDSHDYQSYIVPLRAWWVPDNTKLNLKSFFDYFLFRKTYNELGSQNIQVHVRKDVLDLWEYH